MSDTESAQSQEKLERKAFCSSCGGERNCAIRAYFNERGGDTYMDWHNAWNILQCLGCSEVFVRKTSTNSEHVHYFYNENNEEDSDYIESVTYWPALAKRKFPEWMGSHGLDAEGTEQLDAPLIELYTALNAGLHIISAIGIRTAFDVASSLLGVEDSLTFEQKMEALALAGHITAADRDRLETLIESGNASAHRGWSPTPSELGILMEVLEDFVYGAFIAPYRKRKLDAGIAKMKPGIPSRNRPKKALPKP